MIPRGGSNLRAISLPNLNFRALFNQFFLTATNFIAARKNQRILRLGGELDLSPYREACVQGRRRPYKGGGF
jgi:hypothetical protein